MLMMMMMMMMMMMLLQQLLAMTKQRCKTRLPHPPSPPTPLPHRARAPAKKIIKLPQQ